MRLTTTYRLGLLLGILLSGCPGGISGPGSGNTDGGTGGGVDGFASSDGGAAAPVCPGIPLTSSGALDVDLKTVQVSGAVTVSGQVMPDAVLYRGAIQFTERKTGATASASFNTTGAATYQLTLVPGTYDVRFVANPTLCSSLTNSIPCIGGVLQKGLQLTSSGSASWDLQPIVVSGAATLNGGALPSGADGKGNLVFTSADGGQVDTGVNSASLSSYRLVLLPGVYAVGYKSRLPAACSAGAGLPCIDGPLRPNLNLSSSGSVAIDIATANLSGTIQVGGSAVVMADQGRGSLILTLRGGGSVSTLASPSGTGLATYALTVLKGTYDVSFAPNLFNNDCTSSVPCISGPVQSALVVQSDGAVPFDVPVLTVQGAITINGKTPANTEGGRLRFTLAGGGQVETNLGLRRLDSYALKLLPGSYTVSFINGFGCAASPAEAPCNSGVLKAGLALTTSGEVPFDVQSVTISGQLTVNGQASGSTAGEAVFVPAAAGGGSVGTGVVGSYSVRLLPGVYALDYRPIAPGCVAAGTWPCVGGRLRSGLILTSSGAVNQDIAMFSVSGQVTLDGAPMPSSNLERGQLQFSAPGGVGSTSAFGLSGAVSYQMRLLSGSYTVRHQARAYQCTSGFSVSGVPCIDQYVAGCP